MQTYIKILIYMIDNQQVKYKISILFSVQWSFAVLIFLISEGWGG